MEIINVLSIVIGSIGVVVIVWGALVSALELCITSYFLNKEMGQYHKGE